MAYLQAKPSSRATSPRAIASGAASSADRYSCTGANAIFNQHLRRLVERGGAPN
jgi:hypothetical protein